MYFNKITIYYLLRKEIKRFLKVYNQTIVAPCITGIIFFSVFILALGDKNADIGNISFRQFIASGLVIMSMIQNSFANSSSVIIGSKVMGNIGDYLTPPFTPLELISGLLGGAILRGAIVGVLIFSLLSFFIKFPVFSFSLAIFYAIISCAILALLGIICAVIAETFDQMGAITAYFVTPLSFLSGTFYSVKKLPNIFYQISSCNPFFYMINGFRYGLTGYSDGSITLGAGFLLIFFTILFLVTYYILKTGWRIKT